MSGAYGDGGSGSRAASGRAASAVASSDGPSTDPLALEAMVVGLLSAVFPQIPSDIVKDLLEVGAVSEAQLRTCRAASRYPSAVDLVHALLGRETATARKIIESQCLQGKAMQDAEEALASQPPRADRGRSSHASRSSRSGPPPRKVIYRRTSECSTCSENDDPTPEIRPASSDYLSSSPNTNAVLGEWHRHPTSRSRRPGATAAPRHPPGGEGGSRRWRDMKPVMFWIPMDNAVAGEGETENQHRRTANDGGHAAVELQGRHARAIPVGDGDTDRTSNSRVDPRAQPSSSQSPRSRVERRTLAADADRSSGDSAHSAWSPHAHGERRTPPTAAAHSNSHSGHSPRSPHAHSERGGTATARTVGTNGRFAHRARSPLTHGERGMMTAAAASQSNGSSPHGALSTHERGRPTTADATRFNGRSTHINGHVAAGYHPHTSPRVVERTHETTTILYRSSRVSPPQGNSTPGHLLLPSNKGTHPQTSDVGARSDFFPSQPNWVDREPDDQWTELNSNSLRQFEQ
eukprot:m.295537 g.295537  ORF g.295537 m.295537 type:complete len:520 (+) comp27180_c0_seq2:201-1760(+)